jgi:hypothetical protein
LKMILKLIQKFNPCVNTNIAVSYAYSIQGVFIYVPLTTRVKLELQGKFKMSISVDYTSVN